MEEDFWSKKDKFWDRFFSWYKKTWNKWALAFLIGFLAASCVFATALTPAEATRYALMDCIHEDSIKINWEDSNMGSLVVVCNFAFSEGRQVVITSNHRPKSRGQHKYGNAWDFYLDYTGLIGKCAVWDRYQQDVNNFLHWVNSGQFEPKSGVGIYTNLAHHFDFRDRNSRWGFDWDKNEISYNATRILVEDHVDYLCR